MGLCHAPRVAGLWNLPTALAAHSDTAIARGRTRLDHSRAGKQPIGRGDDQSRSAARRPALLSQRWRSWVGALRFARTCTGGCGAARYSADRECAGTVLVL